MLLPGQVDACQPVSFIRLGKKERKCNALVLATSNRPLALEIVQEVSLGFILLSHVFLRTWNRMVFTKSLEKHHPCLTQDMEQKAQWGQSSNSILVDSGQGRKLSKGVVLGQKSQGPTWGVYPASHYSFPRNPCLVPQVIINSIWVCPSRWQIPGDFSYHTDML